MQAVDLNHAAVVDECDRKIPNAREGGKYQSNNASLVLENSNGSHKATSRALPRKDN